MAKFLDTTGRRTYAIGLCDRCSCKFPLEELFSDPNTPGLKVCRDDLDDYDPYRLPSRRTENITLRFVRPDVDLLDIGTPFVLAGAAVDGAWAAGVWAAGVWAADTWQGIT